MNAEQPSKFWAVAAVITGVFLLVSGIAAGSGYLRLSLLEFFGAEVLIGELSVIGAVALGVVGGLAAIWHGAGSLRGSNSRPMRLPPFYIFYIVFGLVLGIGNLLLVGKDNRLFPGEFVQLVFPPFFVLGASVPVFAALAFAYRRLNWPVTWRQGMLMFICGGTLSIIATILLGGVLPYVYYLLVEPFEYLSMEFIYVFSSGGSGVFARLFESPLIFFYLLYIAFQAPFPEEYAKALGPGFMKGRISSERMAFALGLASGAGFAVIENMRYQGLFAQFYGWSWGGITALRGIGAVDHALWTGIIALAVYRERGRLPGWGMRIVRAYLFSVGLHTLWNGGYMALLYLVGLDHYAGAGPSFSVYGEYIEISLILILVAMTALNWWILLQYLNRLRADQPVDIASARVTTRALAGWAFACVLVIVPIGAALGQAWQEIRQILVW